MVSIINYIYMYITGLGSWSQSEPGVFGSLEPEPLEEKPGAGAAWKKSQEQEPEPLIIWPAPQPCEKIKSIRKLYSFFR